MKKMLSILCLLFVGLTVNAQTFQKMEGTALVSECATFAVNCNGPEYVVVAADKSGNEITRWYLPAATATVTKKRITFKSGMSTYELSRPVKTGK